MDVSISRLSLALVSKPFIVAVLRSPLVYVESKKHGKKRSEGPRCANTRQHKVDQNCE